MDPKYIAWLDSLPKDKSCYVRVKYKPQYFNGQEETLKWNPKCNVTAFWCEEEDGPLSIWWRWIKSFSIIESKTQPR